MSSKTRKRPYSSSITRTRTFNDGPPTKEKQIYGYQTNPQTNEPARGASGSIERVYREQKRVVDRARRQLDNPHTMEEVPLPAKYGRGSKKPKGK